MSKIYVYSCLLSAVSIVETLNINGHVGKNVTIKCSDWNTWTNVKSHVKYLCESPCSKEKDIILKAAYKKTEREKQIELTNSAEGLFVTFINVQKSDSKKYFCGVERVGPDAYIEVNLKVTDAESSSPKTTPKTAIDGSTLSFAVKNSSTMSLYGSDIITDLSTSYIIHSTTPTASVTQEAGSVLYLIIGVIAITTILMVLLRFMRKMTKKQLIVSGGGMPQENVREDVEYDEIRPEDLQAAGVSTICFRTIDTDADQDSFYANYSNHRDTELAAERGNALSEALYLNLASSSHLKLACTESRVTDPPCDLVYSVAQLPKEQIEPTGQSEPNQSESNENDSFYSLAQL